MNRFFLLSSPIHTGKTTKLTEWIKNKDDVDGILQPVINGKRHIKHISSGEIRLLEILPDSNEKNIITIGNYKFSSEVFSWARDQIISSYNKHPKWLIIDEIGKLEITDKGLEPAVSKILNDINDPSEVKIVFVVRDYLVLNFLNNYGLSKNDIQTLEL